MSSRDREKRKEQLKGPGSKLGQRKSSAVSFFETNKTLILQVVIAIAVIIFASTIYKSSNVNLTNLVNKDASVLKEAFFGDQQYLFYCNRGGKDETVPKIFSELNILRSNKMKFAYLNCSQTGPSGRSIFDKFKLKKEVRPTIFSTAPWLHAPKQIPLANFKDINALTKYVDMNLAARAVDISTDKELQQYCYFNKPGNIARDMDDLSSTACVVIMKGTRFGKSHQGIEEKLIRNNPKGVKFVSMDASSRRLSFEDTEAMPADHFAIKLHAIKNGSYYMSMTNPATWDYLNTFISHAAGTSLSGYSKYVDLPEGGVRKGKKKGSESLHPATSADVIKVVKIKESVFKDRSAPPVGQGRARGSKTSRPSEEPTPEDPSSSSSSSSFTEEKKEEVRRLNKERERQRREQMEEEAKRSLYDDADGASSDASQEEEEEVIEL